MGTEQWEDAIEPALHSIRSLLCTSTNATPHERMFSHPRGSHNGSSLPTWLKEQGNTVPMKNHTRSSKNEYEPLVQEVELIEANPDYACVKLKDGRETTVSLRHLVPHGDGLPSEQTSNQEENSHVYNEDTHGDQKHPAEFVEENATPKSPLNMSYRPTRL